MRALESGVYWIRDSCLWCNNFEVTIQEGEGVEGFHETDT